MRKPRETAAWRELFRCDDLVKARAVAASIAAMEFDVRLSNLIDRDGADEDADAPALDSPDFADDFEGPYRVEVPDDHFPELADVLSEIINEQDEFDQWLELRQQQRQTRLLIVLSVAGAVEVLAVLKWVDV